MSSKRAASKVTWEFFELLAKFGKGEQIIFKAYSEVDTKVPKTTFFRKIRKFEKHGLILKKHSNKGHVFVVTPKAKYLRHKAISKVLRQDGNSTLVIFDIPEEKHNARDTLRRYLIRSGYTQIRESCFLSPFKIPTDLKSLISELKLRENVSVFSAKSDYLF